MALPTTVPIALTPEFATLKATAWLAFIRRNALATVEMTGAMDVIRVFTWPAMEAASNAAEFNRLWTCSKGWHHRLESGERLRQPHETSDNPT